MKTYLHIYIIPLFVRFFNRKREMFIKVSLFANNLSEKYSLFQCGCGGGKKDEK